MARRKKKAGKQGWTRSAPNLVRWEPSGVYYVRVRIGRKEAYRKSLKTTDYQTAIKNRDKALAELRANAPIKKGTLPITLWEVLKSVRGEIESNPALKKRSVRAYVDVIKALQPGKKCGVPDVPLASLIMEEMASWWKRTADYYAPAKANFHLLVVRRALRAARESGAMFKDLAKGLKRVHVPRTKLNLVTQEQFAELVKKIREDDEEEAEDAADWVEFACYTGARPEEVNSVRWEHLDMGKRTLRIVGGEEGTKNRKERRVPVTDALAWLLERIAAKRGGREGFIVVPSPYYGKILSRVSESIEGMPRLRRYDLRHLFATRCNEAGVDVPTFARWLGHQDGGALAMRTYVHPHEDHERQAALKVRF
jgi:integrase